MTTPERKDTSISLRINLGKCALVDESGNETRVYTDRKEALDYIETMLILLMGV